MATRGLETQQRTQQAATRWSLTAIGIAVATVVLVVLLWYIVDVLLLVFAAAMLALLFRAPADWLARRTPLSPGWSLTVALFALTVLVGLVGWLFGHVIADQAEQLARRLPEILRSVQERMTRYDWAMEYMRPEKLLDGNSEFIGKGLRAVTTTFGAMANLGIVLLMALFLAAQPSLYINGLVRLVPIPRRRRAHEVLKATGHTLRRWLVGQLVLMLVVTILTSTGLWALGVPYPLALGLLAGLLTFVPYLGPILAVVPAALVALSEDTLLAAYVVGLYVGVQIVEGLLEPIVQQRAVYLPPVLLIFAQVVLGILLGPLGVVLATPLAAAAMVAVNLIYIEDVLGDRGAGAAHS
ncbi:MAG: AI-2E family transporter [Gammaproteobacteria bacterium]